MTPHAMRTKRTWQERRIALAVAALAVFAIGLGLRLHYQERSAVRRPVITDARHYYLGAYNLYTHGVYSTSGRRGSAVAPEPDTKVPPGYSLFLLAFRPDNSVRAFLARVLPAQAVLGAASAVLALLLARMLLPLPWATAVGLLTAASPHLIAMTGYLLSETLFTLVLLAAMLAFALSWRRRSVTPTLLAGALFGAASLVRPLVLYLPIWLAALYAVDASCWRLAPRRRWLWQLPVFALGFALSFGPYLVRNTIEFGDASPGSGRAWGNFLQGTYIDMVHRDPRRRGYVDQDDPLHARMRKDRAFAWRELQRRFEADPIGHLRWYLGGKLRSSWGWDVYTGNGDVYVYPMKRRGFHSDLLLGVIHRSMRLAHAPLVILAFAAPLLFCLARWREKSVERAVILAPALLILLYHALLLTALKPIPRYTIPIRPYAYLLAVASLWLAAGLLRDWRAARRDLNEA